MTDFASPQHSSPAGQRRDDTASQRQADTAGGRQADTLFLRRILFGLIAATVLSGAVTLGLTTHNEFFERLQVASNHGPA